MKKFLVRATRVVAVSLVLSCVVFLLISLLSACADGSSSDTSSTSPKISGVSVLINGLSDLLPVVDLDSFHESPDGPCITLRPGSYHQSVHVKTSETIQDGVWKLDQASSQHVRGAVEVGTCFLYRQVHYQVYMP